MKSIELLLGIADNKKKLLLEPTIQSSDNLHRSIMNALAILGPEYKIEYYTHVSLLTYTVNTYFDAIHYMISNNKVNTEYVVTCVHDLYKKYNFYTPYPTAQDMYHQIRILKSIKGISNFHFFTYENEGKYIHYHQIYFNGDDINFRFIGDTLDILLFAIKKKKGLRNSWNTILFFVCSVDLLFPEINTVHAEIYSQKHMINNAIETDRMVEYYKKYHNVDIYKNENDCLVLKWNYSTIRDKKNRDNISIFVKRAMAYAKENIILTN